MMRRFAALVARVAGSVALALGLLAGCDDEAINTPPPQVCTTATCPVGWCELNLSLAPSCDFHVAFAEVLLDGALEPGVLRPGETFTSTGHIPRGEDGTFYVRAEDWQWRIELTCNDPAVDGQYQLSCTASADDAPARPVGGADARTGD